jgi:hypothetical protein
MFDAGEQFCLIFLTRTLVEAVNEDDVGKTAGVPIAIRTQSLERANNEGLHLSSDCF